MKKVKNKKTVLILLIVIFIIILVLAGLFLFYTFSGNYINISLKDDSANNVDASLAKDSDIIIVNGVVLGASKNNKWISASKYYDANNSKSGIDVELFSDNKEYGQYKTASIKRYDKSVVYTTIARATLPEKYLALTYSDDVEVMPGMTKLKETEDDINYVLDAIGSYKLINGSVKINEVYGTKINENTDKIICATSSNKNLLGVYSVVVFVSGNKAHLVKYSYVRNTDNSDKWPVYSLLFVMDLNKDSKPEIVLQELTGKNVSYSVLELRENNNFYEILRTTLAI